MDYKYWWDGKSQALLVPRNVYADWYVGKGAGGEQALQIANRAFQIYYDARRKIDMVSLSESGGWELYKACLETLHSLATEGSGFGVKDLEDAFKHLASKGTQWYDDNTGDYSGSSKKSYSKTVHNAPEFAVNFLNAVDKNLMKLKNEVWVPYTGALKHLELLSTKPKTASDWEKYGAILKQVDQIGKYAKPFLWAAPQTQEKLLLKGNKTLLTIEPGRAIAHGATLKSISYVGVLAQIESGLSMYAKARASNFSKTDSTLLALADFGFNYIPILGAFYSKAIALIPTIKTEFEAFMKNYLQRIDQRSKVFLTPNPKL
jgi:hypothetical protein